MKNLFRIARCLVGRKATLVLFLCTTVLVSLNATPSWALSVSAEPSSASTSGAAQPQQTAAEEEHSLPQNAVEVTRLFGLPITNSMIVTWIVALSLIVFAHFATRNMRLVPAGTQNFWEWLVEDLQG